MKRVREKSIHVSMIFIECVKNANSIYQDENQKYFVQSTPNRFKMLKEHVGGVSKIKEISLNEQSKKRRKEVEVGLITLLKMRNFLTNIAY